MAYDQTTVDALNAIITDLESVSNLDTSSYIPKLNNNMQLWNGLCAILEQDKWIKPPVRNMQGNVITISRSNAFHGKLLQGRYSIQPPMAHTIHAMHPVIHTQYYIADNHGTMNNVVNQGAQLDSIIQDIRTILAAHAEVSSEDREEIIELLKADMNDNAVYPNWLAKIKKYESLTGMASLILQLVPMIIPVTPL